MTGSHQVPRFVGRTFLTVLAALAAVGILLAVLVGLIHLAKGPFGVAGYSFEVITPTAEITDLPVVPAPELANAQPWRALVTTSQPLTASKTMAAIALMAPFAVFVASCLVVLVLVRRLWVGKPFSRFAAWSLAVLGGLVTALGFVRPFLEVQAIRSAIAELGLVTMPDTPPDPLPAAWVVPPVWDWTASDWPMVVLGVVLMLLGWLLFRGLRLQRDVEGLV